MPEPLAIAIVCYPSLGGSGIIAADLAAGLAQRGHCIHLVATDLPSRRLPDSPNLYFHEVRPVDYPLFEHPPYGIAIAAKLVEIATNRRLDAVHAHYAIPHAASAYLARQVLAPNAPKVIATLHGTDVTQLGHDPSYRSIIKFAIEQADRVTVPSQFLRDETHRLLAVAESRHIDVIPNFVDTDHFAPPPERLRSHFDGLFPESEPGAAVLAHVSNFRPIKRVGDVLEVLLRLRHRMPARAVLIGDGPERPLAARRAAELGLTPHVAFVGKRTDFAHDLGHADAFVLPSASESFGVAALEALSCGVPVFGYRVGGLPEVVVPEAGGLVDPFDRDALATAVAAVCEDGELRAQMSGAGRARVLAHFRREPALDRYEALIRETVAADASPPRVREVG